MRTEEEILKDFEKLDYNKQSYDGDYYELVKKIDKATKYIVIEPNIECAGCHVIVKDKEYPYSFTREEIKLLHELFEIWGWLK